MELYSYTQVYIYSYILQLFLFERIEMTLSLLVERFSINMNHTVEECPK